jgi:UDP-N-acetylmuramate--alanine ligase
VTPDNAEVLEAQARGIPVFKRSGILGALMADRLGIAIAGTHGKTTTTTMVAALLEAGGFDPTVINGGIINKYGTNARLGQGEWMVVEADESDGSFLRLPATVAVVTNIDPEHLDHFGTFDRVRDAFRQFVESIPFYSFAVVCIDHPEVQNMIGRISDRRLVTYGFSPQADVRALDLEQSPAGGRFDVRFSDRVLGGQHAIDDMRMPILGRHNVQNALAAMAVANELGFSHGVIRRTLASFKGVKRRFTKTGEVNGITVVDDYGHHPVEIAAVLTAARQAHAGRIIAVVQPHRFTRLRDLFEDFCTCFNHADTVIVADVYSAGEPPIEGIHRDALVEGLRKRGHRHAVALPGPDKLADMVADEAGPGDLVVCLGAGSITNWANALPVELAQRLGAPGARVGT